MPRFRKYILVSGLVGLLSHQVLADTQILLDDGTRIDISNGISVMSRVGETQSMVFNSQTRVMNIVDHSEGSYTPVSMQKIEESVATISSFRDSMLLKMQAQLKTLPTEQRQVFDDAMRQYLPADTQGALQLKTVSKGNEVIAGISCSMQSLYDNKQHIADVCMSIKASGGLTKEDQVTLLAMMKFFKEMASKTAGLMASLEAPKLLSKTQLEGWPVKFVDLQNGTQYAVKSVARHAYSPEYFTGHLKYQRKEMPTLQGVQQ
ncbi:MAG: hypothetical protein V3W04_11370 [Gammaproteobacteria bacterium]